MDFIVYKIYLASQSPRRAELLKMIGIDFEILKLDIPEIVLPNEKPEDYSKRIVEEKLVFAKDVVDKKKLVFYPILCADTEVIHQGMIYGKPKNYEDAFRMLQSYSERSHLVLTTLGIIDKDYHEFYMQKTYVYFSKLSDSAIHQYLNKNQYQDKAGAYAIQSSISQYIEKIDGCYYGVMGLPLNGVRLLLENLKKSSL